MPPVNQGGKPAAVFPAAMGDVRLFVAGLESRFEE